MCGQAGIIFGTKRRCKEERDHLAQIFTELLVLNEERGPFATGVALVNRDGSHRLYKRPVRARRLIGDPIYRQVLGEVTNDTTVLLGHTRWPTQGSHLDNRNNQPLLVGDAVIGTHNGTITNADHLFHHFGLPRSAEVDSEVIFRLAEDTLHDGTVDMAALGRRLSLCRGQLSAVIVSKLDPGAVVIARANKPIELRYHPRYRAVVYASDPGYLDCALGDDNGWVTIATGPMRVMTFRCSRLPRYAWSPFYISGFGR